ncbi:MAG: sugar transferase, partial [Verrucomicrobiota bacterium]|nr:sugar transferase [Verrucomicrobiota bacterium]
SLWVTPIDFQGTLGLEITKNLLNPFSKKLKIVCDYFFVILLFPIWLLLILIIGLLIIFEDGRNPLFFQERIGEEGKIFNTIKFRTMVPDAESKLKLALENNKDLLDEWNKSYKLKKDPRITKVGKILRITSLDELPQLFNVLNGTMSVVGPRPLPIYHFQELPNYVQDLRNKVKPGITGLWQVSGRSEVGTSGMKKWDPYYVRNWSIWLDIVILFKTIKAVFSAKGAY